jgi:AbrB family looped-hinge helix DNA binding protein
MGAFVTVTSKGQLTIPKDIRDKLDITEGTQCYVTEHGGEVIIIPRNKSLADLAGFLGDPPRGKGATQAEIDDAVRTAVGRHVAGHDADDDE